MFRRRHDGRAWPPAGRFERLGSPGVRVTDVALSSPAPGRLDLVARSADHRVWTRRAG